MTIDHSQVLKLNLLSFPPGTIWDVLISVPGRLGEILEDAMLGNLMQRMGCVKWGMWDYLRTQIILEFQ